MIDTLTSRQEILEFLGRDATLSATIEVTKKCNLHCKHCAPAAGGNFDDELTYTEIKKVIDDLERLGALTIIFTGGEPFVRPDFLKILEYTHGRHLGISILTNGLLLNRDILRKLNEFDVKLIRISLEGPEKIHDAIRGVDGAWRRTVGNIRLARKVFKGQITVTAVMMKENWKVLDKILLEAVKLKVDVFSLLFLVKVGRAKSSASSLTAEEYYKSLGMLFRQYKKVQKRIRFSTNIAFPFAILPPDLRKKTLSRKIEGCTLSTTLMIKANGDVGPCDCLSNFPRMVFGNTRKKSLSQIVNSSLVKRVRNFPAENLTGVCGKCLYQTICRGSCRAFSYGEYRRLNAPNPVCQVFYEHGYFPAEGLRLAKVA